MNLKQFIAVILLVTAGNFESAAEKNVGKYFEDIFAHNFLGKIKTETSNKVLKSAVDEFLSVYDKDEKFKVIVGDFGDKSDHLKFSANLQPNLQNFEFELNFPSFYKLFNDVKYSIDKFNATISKLPASNEELLPNIESIFELYQQKNNLQSMISSAISISSEFSSNDSIADFLIRSMKKEGESFQSKISSSPMQFVYEFYLGIIEIASQGDVIMNIYAALKENLKVSSTNFKRFSSLTTEFYESFAETLKKLQKQKSTFLNFNKIQEVKLKNVIQLFLQNEYQLSGNTTCSRDCGHYDDYEYNNDGCYGKVHKCDATNNGLDLYYKSINQDERIYEGFTVENMHWQGKQGSPPYSFANFQVCTNYVVHFGAHRVCNLEPQANYSKFLPSTIREGNFWFVFPNYEICQKCRCTCDQSNKESVRKMYTGRIDAPDGHVITGVRFKEHNKVIFLQIQTGKLLSLGIVDKSSVDWQKLPDDVGSNYYEFNYTNRLMDLSEAVLNGTLTGIEFYVNNNVLHLKAHGRKFKNFETGKLSSKIISSSNHTPSIPVVDLEYKKPASSGSNFKTFKSKTIKLGRSNEKFDAGQSFVPYFDGSDVTTDNKVPLCGLRLLQFTGDESFAGYIKPQLITLNLSSFVKK